MIQLRVYGLAQGFYQEVSNLKMPQHLKNQLVRAAASIACNIAEGSGRSTKPDQRRFYIMAYASAKECTAVLTMANVKFEVVLDKVDHLCASLYKLTRVA